MDIYDLIKKACAKGNFSRIKYVDNNIPSNMDDIVILLFFGDFKHATILSKLLLKRFKEQLKGTKYFILVSWPGHEVMYPYVDEYWSINDASTEFFEKAEGFLNNHESYLKIIRSLNYFFQDLIYPETFEKFYDDGLTLEFFNVFKEISVFNFSVPSSISSLGIELSKKIQSNNRMVFLTCSKKIKKYYNNQETSDVVPESFWVNFCQELLKERIIPIVLIDELSYDISKEVTDCIYVNNLTTGQILSLIRNVGCVLDVFNGLSYLSIMAKTPYIALDERNRYFNLKEYELNDIFASNIPKERIYTFSNIITSGNTNDWKNNIIDLSLNKINNFLPFLNRDDWEPLNEGEKNVDYSEIKRKNMLKLGAKFFKIKQLNID